MEFSMYRSFSFATFVALSTLAGGIISSASAAESAQDRFCLQGRQSGYPGNCEFSTYQQCLATASGANEGCGINPMRAYEGQQRYSRYRVR
ncbi:DUF3551 domain-containing protein [Bradyrhizobium sp. CCGUVB14]|uniref:DUF3551 domain-containing protein n=1 Tax=Bradyrhizobium sp. CCGUVB14 TaxID=2949628 RepID=UPI0035C103B5